MGDSLKISIKKWALFILIPVILGGIVGFITMGSNDYKNLIQPSFAPPGWLFPIVWTILYILMGISSCIVYSYNSKESSIALKSYVIQLIVNYLWSFFFFFFKFRTFAFIWLLLLVYLVFDMIIKFYKVSKTSSYLQIPYLLWISFASILNLSIVLLN